MEVSFTYFKDGKIEQIKATYLFVKCFGYP